MKRFNEVMDMQYDALKNRDWDNVVIVVGDEGTGKSTLLLHILDYWNTIKYGKVLKEHIKFINLDIGAWADSLANCEKVDINVLDESGDLSGRRAMSKLNVAVSRAYQIIRGDNINSFLALPDLFWLDGFFTKRRARGMIYVYKRGRFAYWSRDKLRKIIDLNANRVLKSVWVVKPSFYDTFPKYKGILLQPYMDKKKLYMVDTRKELAEAIKEIKGKASGTDPLNEKIRQMTSEGKTNQQIADEIGLSRSAVGRRLATIVSKELDTSA